MKHLWIGMLAVAALAISAPVSAQPAKSAPPGTNITAPAASAAHMGSRTRAHHRRHAVRSVKHKSTESGGTANQLNREERDRIQAKQAPSVKATR